jgi:hypothetical protein
MSKGTLNLLVGIFIVWTCGVLLLGIWLMSVFPHEHFLADWFPFLVGFGTGNIVLGIVKMVKERKLKRQVKSGI